MSTTFDPLTRTLDALAELPARMERMEGKLDALSNEPEPLVVTVGEAAKMLRVSSRTIYKLIASGSLPAYKIGTATRIQVAVIKEWVENGGRNA